MLLNRRNFLKAITASALGSNLSACTHKKLFNPDEDIFLSGGSYLDGGNIQHALIVINLTQTEKRVIETKFLPHGIYINPNNKYRIYCFEKNGSNACEIDLQTKEVIRHLHTETNQLFSGHANFSADGNTLYCVETNVDTLQGSINVRDTETFHSRQQLPTVGLSPHDCQLNGSVLTVSNTGQSTSGFHQPSVVRIDLTTEKLSERIKLENKSLNCGHFHISDNEDIIIASAPLDTASKNASGGISFHQQNKTTITMTEPDVVIKRMTGEALSIQVNRKHQIAAVTHPEANLLTFWSSKDQKIIKAFGFENPRGISQTLDQNNFVVSYGNKPAIALVTIENLSPQIESVIQPTFTSGEHLLNWSENLREIMPTHVYG